MFAYIVYMYKKNKTGLQNSETPKLQNSKTPKL